MRPSLLRSFVARHNRYGDDRLRLFRGDRLPDSGTQHFGLVRPFLAASGICAHLTPKLWAACQADEAATPPLASGRGGVVGRCKPGFGFAFSPKHRRPRHTASSREDGQVAAPGYSWRLSQRTGRATRPARRPHGWRSAIAYQSGTGSWLRPMTGRSRDSFESVTDSVRMDAVGVLTRLLKSSYLVRSPSRASAERNR